MSDLFSKENNSDIFKVKIFTLSTFRCINVNRISCIRAVFIHLRVIVCFWKTLNLEELNLVGREDNSLEMGTVFFISCYIASVNKTVCLSRMVNH